MCSNSITKFPRFLKFNPFEIPFDEKKNITVILRRTHTEENDFTPSSITIPKVYSIMLYYMFNGPRFK